MPSIRPGGTNSLKKIDFFHPTSYMYEPRGVRVRARIPRRLGALRSRSAPAEARTAGSNRPACSRCVPTFSRGGFGTEEKCDFQIGQLLLLRSRYATDPLKSRYATDHK